MRIGWRLDGLKHDTELDNEKAARLLGLKPGTLHILRARGKGPAFARRGHRIVYTVRDLETYLNARWSLAA